MGWRDIEVKSQGSFPERATAQMPREGQSLLARLDSFLGPRYTAFVVFLAVLLGVLLALAAYLDGGIRQRDGLSPWMVGLDPVILVYILALHPLMHRRWLRAMQSLEALAPHAENARRAGVAAPRGEWAAVVLGAMAGLAVARRGHAADAWLWVYSEATSAAMFALLGATIYGSVMRSRQLAAYLRSRLELKVFDGHLLTPFAQWGQSLSLVFVGGISLSLLFQSYQSLRSIESAIIYGCLIVVAMTLFFMSMWTVHVALAKAQAKELATVRGDLAAARQALFSARDGNTASAVQEAYLPAVTLGIYERQVLDASTWPFDLAIVGRVFASVGAPLAVYLLKLAFGVGGML
ncbi:hypothetical protein BH11PSE9_BH11PSE9_21190 [soil metagenome]